MREALHPDAESAEECGILCDGVETAFVFFERASGPKSGASNGSSESSARDGRKPGEALGGEDGFLGGERAKESEAAHDTIFVGLRGFGCTRGTCWRASRKESLYVATSDFRALRGASPEGFADRVEIARGLDEAVAEGAPRLDGSDAEACNGIGLRGGFKGKCEAVDSRRMRGSASK